MPEPSSTLEPPTWPHCGIGAETADRVGCRGRRIDPHAACLAHLDAEDRDSFFSGLTPGGEVDLRGTTITSSQLSALLSAIHDPNESRPCFGSAVFEDARFPEDARFINVKFLGVANFVGVHFEGDARFNGAYFSEAEFSFATFDTSPLFIYATFSGKADFISATFHGETALFDYAEFAQGVDFESVDFEGFASFCGVKFQKRAGFLGATFHRAASFDRAIFESCYFPRAEFVEEANFKECRFSGGCDFSGVVFHDVVSFERAEFHVGGVLGPFVCRREVRFDDATFLGSISVSLLADEVSFLATRWEHSAKLTLGHAKINLANAVLTQPVSVRCHSRSTRIGWLDDLAGFMWSRSGIVVSSLHGVDCSLLALSDVNLTGCTFSGALHLDQLQLGGNWAFSYAPKGWHWRRAIPVRWTQRQVVEEEREWRAKHAHPAALRGGWGQPRWANYEVADLSTIAVIYRQLRKAREDAKDEPGAADFYYGEMEMRRHARGWRTAERWLLQAYWLLSGYGLRASRALAWLALAMMTTILLMMGFGLPNSSPKQEASGTVPPGGGKVTFEIDKQDPRNPGRDRFTTLRFEKALNVTLNSVVFRSSGQDLTTAGGYIEMASRFTEPVLLGLAALAIRGRVKR